MDKPKTTLLTVIWGARYIEEFARVSLPSYLAAGNLPALVEEMELEIVVLTSSTSIPIFSGEPIFDQLRALCPVRFIIIDDLITTGNYGVTLTLAYARGIVDAGDEQTNTNFVFMNADFVLADGSLRALAKRLKAGERCIMAPSLRAVSDQTVPQIKAAVDEDSFTLSMPSRQLVRLAFDNLHPTVIAKTVTQNFVTCQTHNQIYWQVDDNTLLARYHLIFMLAIKPEVPLGPIDSYCDYGFVPDLVPSGQFSILNDSDEFFMLELQPASQERNLLRGGGATVEQIGAELTRWTTAEHRRFAAVDVVFKAADPSPRLTAVKTQAAEYFEKLRQQMSPTPMPHGHHFYWVMGLQSWAALKFAGQPEPQVTPPEILGGTTPAIVESGAAPGKARTVPLGERFEWFLYRSYTGLIKKLRTWQGSIPTVAVWHHLWLDSRMVREWLQAAPNRRDGRHLLICEATNPLAAQMPLLMQFDVCLEPDHLDAFVDERRDPTAATETRYDTIFLQVRRANVRNARRIIEDAQRYLKSDGSIAVFIWHENSELDSSNFSSELAAYTDEILPSSWLGFEISSRFVGGRLKRGLRKAERLVIGYLVPTNRRRIPLLVFAFAIWPAVAALTAVNNLLSQTKVGVCPDYCSSALICLRRRTDAAKPSPTNSPTPRQGQKALPEHV